MHPLSEENSVNRCRLSMVLLRGYIGSVLFMCADAASYWSSIAIATCDTNALQVASELDIL